MTNGGTGELILGIKAVANAKGFEVRYALVGPGNAHATSPAITRPPQVGCDGLLQFRGPGEPGVQSGDEARHLFRKGGGVVSHSPGADGAGGREDVPCAAVSAVVADLQKPGRSE